MKKSIALLLLLLFSVAKNYAQSTDITYINPDFPSDQVVSACNTTTLTFHFDMGSTVLGANDELVFTLNVPTDLEIVGVQPTSNSPTTSFAASGEITLTNMSTSMDVEVLIEGDCELFGNNQLITLNISNVLFNAIQINSATNNISLNVAAESSVINPANSQSTNLQYSSAVINAPFSRVFVFENTSTVPFHGAIQFQELYTGVNIENSLLPIAVTSSGGTVNPLVPVISTSSIVQTILVPANDPIPVNGTVRIEVFPVLRNCVIATNLQDGVTAASIQYGCDLNDLCKTSVIVPTSAQLNDDEPVYSALRNNEYNCVSSTNPSSDHRTYTITNAAPLASDGKANYLEIEIHNATVTSTRRNSISYLDEASLTAVDGSQNNLDIELVFQFVTSNTYVELVNPGEPIGRIYRIRRLDQFGNVDPFLPGESIQLDYDFDHYCPLVADYADFFDERRVILNDMNIRGRFIKECVTPEIDFTFNGTQTLPSIGGSYPAVPPGVSFFTAADNTNANWQPAHKISAGIQGPIVGPATLLDDIVNNFTETGTYTISSSLAYDDQVGLSTKTFVGDPSEMRIHVSVDVGAFLDFNSTNVTLTGQLANGSFITIAGTGIISPPQGNGTEVMDVAFSLPANFYQSASGLPYGLQWELTDDFEVFLNNFEIELELRPDCSESNFGQSTIVPVVERLFVSFGSCPSVCRFPLTTKDRTVTVTCPGCLTPGWNVNGSTITRVTLDQLDDDNNHFPDDPTNPSSIAGTGVNPPDVSAVTTGDIFELFLDAALTDGDDGALAGCNLTFGSGIWGDFLYGEIEVTADLMGDLNFLGAKGNYRIGNAGVGEEFTLPPSAFTIVNAGEGVLAFNVSDLNSGATNGSFLPAAGFGNQDRVQISLFFQLVNPPSVIERMGHSLTTQINMSATEFDNPVAPCTASKPDILGQSCAQIATADANNELDCFFHWCTGGVVDLYTVGFLVNEQASASDHVGRSTCNQQIRIRGVASAGQSGISWITVQPHEEFPFESRDFHLLEEFRFNIPAEFEFDHIEVRMGNLDNNGGFNAISCGFGSNNILNLPAMDYDLTNASGQISIAQGTGAGGGDLVVVNNLNNLLFEGNNTSGTLFDCNNGNLINPYDELKVYQISCFVRLVDCNTTPGLISMNGVGGIHPGIAYPVETVWGNRPDVAISSGTCDCDDLTLCPERGSVPTSYNPNGVLSVPEHDINLTLAANGNPVYGGTPNLSFGFDLEITQVGANSNNGVDNFFLYFESSCGTFTPSQVMFDNNGAILNHTNQIYELDWLGLNASELVNLGNGDWSGLLNVEGTFDCVSCGANDGGSITVYYGWGCDGYPTDATDPAQSCFLQTFTLPLQASDADLTGINVLGAPLSIALCNSQFIDVEIDVTGSFPVQATELTINLPAGMTFAGSQPTISYQGATAQPTNFPVAGTQSYTFELNTSGFGSFIGNCGGGTNCDPVFTFEVETSCSYDGSPLDFSVNAEDYCGKPFFTDLLSTPGETVADKCTAIDVLESITHVTCSNNGAIDLTVTGAGPFTYIWTPGNATTQDLNNVGIGIYDVEITDAQGCSSMFQYEVLDQTSVNVSIQADIQSCFDNATLTAISIGGVSWLWSTGESTETIFISAPGTYWVQVTDGNNCTSTATIVVPPIQPLVPVIASQTNNSCSGSCMGTVDIDATGIQPITYYITPLNPNSSGEFTGLCSGISVITVVDGYGCSTTIDVDITGGVSQMDITGDITHICSGVCKGAIDITVTGGQAPYSYDWSNGATTEDLNVQGLCEGSYTVIVTDANGCMSTETFVVQAVSTIRDFSIVHTGNCVYQFTDLSIGVNANIIGWNWNFGDNTTSTDQNPLHAFQNPGTYNVCLTVVTDFGYCPEKEYCQQIEVTCEYQECDVTANFNSFQNANSTVVAFNNFSSTPNPAITIIGYEWSFGDGATSTQVNPLHTYPPVVGPQPDMYTVQLVVTATNGIETCKDTVRKKKNVKKPKKKKKPKRLGLGDEENDAADISIELVPNPSSGLTRIVGEFSGEEVYISVTNMNGARILDEIHSTESSITLNLSNQPAGMYSIQIIDAGRRYERRLVIMK